MVSRWLNSILLFVCALCLLIATQFDRSARAQQRTSTQYEVLLLEHNRIMKGRITASKDTLSVEQDAAGVLIVPKSQVRFQGPDMNSIYVFLRDELPREPSADDHVRLARWCITYKMFPEARLELETALEQEPGRDDIRRNLSTLDSFVKRSNEPTKPVKSLSPSQRHGRMLVGLGGEEVESLGGLSREAGQQFTTRVQPILMRNCTNAACHGPTAEHPLKLSIVRLGSNSLRSASEKNLLALLEYVDRDQPRASPLWKILTTNHGAQGSSIFTGSKGSQQLQTCKDWVLSIGTAADIEDEDDAPPRKKNRVTQVADSKMEPKKPGKLNRTRSSAEETQETSQEEMNPAESVASAPRKSFASGPGAETLVGRKKPASTPYRTGNSPEPQEYSGDESPESTDSNLSDVEPIVSKHREPLPELALEDAFDPEVFNRRQRMKRQNEE